MNEKLNTQDLIDLLADRHGMSKKNADSFVKEFFVLIEEALEKDKYVKVKGLGTFKLIDVDSRESVNVNTGERFEIQGHSKVSFTPEAILKDVVNKPFAHFETVVLNDDTAFEDVALEGDNEEEEENGSANREKIVATEKVADKDILTSPESVIEKPIDIKPSIAAIKREEALQMDEGIIGGQSPANATTMKFFAGIVLFVVVLCIGAIVFLCYPDLFDSSTVQPPVKEMVKADSVIPTDKTLLVDTLPIKEEEVQVDNKNEMQAKANEEIVQQEPPVSKPEVKPIASTEETKGTVEIPKGYVATGGETIHVVEDGETLSKVSQRFYSTTSLWMFIVNYNADIIKNPDYVPAGTKIKILNLKKKQ